LDRGIPLFLDQWTETLRLDLANNPDNDRAASRHGGDLMTEGLHDRSGRARLRRRLSGRH